MQNRITKSEHATPSDAQLLSRRTMLKRGGALAGAAALVGGVQLSATAAERDLQLDVACDGGTLVINRSPGVEPDAPVARGDTFIVQGRIFPGGTIDQGLTHPHQEGSIGTWICRGWWYFGLDEISEGAAPHQVTTQVFLFDDFDGLVSEGVEGGITTIRAVTGGYGGYHGIRGDVREEVMTRNDTVVNLGGGTQGQAPNFRFNFRLDG